MKLSCEVANASKEKHIIPGFNIFGFEDALGIIRSAERADSPVILMLNSVAIRAMPVKSWGALLTSIVADSKVPVGIHLDHSSDLKTIFEAIDCGFTSVMYDGSNLALDQNIKNTSIVAKYAHAKNVLVEAEIGKIPYIDLGETEIEFSCPKEAAEMAANSGADWLAISVGNVHRLTEKKVRLSMSRLSEIEATCKLPLVIHGASGIDVADIQALKSTNVGKINIGTLLRQEFGKTLRKTIETTANTFDRVELLGPSFEAIENLAYTLMKDLKSEKEMLNRKRRIS